MIHKTILAIALFAVATGSTASILRYELDFSASTLISESDTYVLHGSGFLLADTELDAVIGGRLESDDITFSWSDPAPSPLEFLENYSGADRLKFVRADGINEVTGESGYILLSFLLWPGGGAPYASRLHTNQWYDNFSELHFSSARPDDSPWFNQPLRTDLDIAPPTYADGRPLHVTGPSSLILLAVGLIGLGWRRFRQAG